jgi:hypothetical protein
MTPESRLRTGGRGTLHISPAFLVIVLVLEIEAANHSKNFSLNGRRSISRLHAERSCLTSLQ